MATNGTVQDWFKAALLHDLGKTRGWTSPEGKKHDDWSSTPYANRSDWKDIADLAAKHDTQVFQDRVLDAVALLALADKLQKGLYGKSAIETGEPLPPDLNRATSKLEDTPNFQSYYGAPIVWDASHRSTRESEILQDLKKQSSLENLVKLQREKLADYPHTSYIPYLALGVHQQITAVLFFFLWRKMKRENLVTPNHLRGFTFHAFTITPEPLAFFYRLRYLNAYREVAEKLQTYLFRELFVPLQREGLSELTPNANPFQFFHGSSFVLMYDDDARVLQVLQNFLATLSVPLDALNTQIHSYTLTEWKVTAGGWVVADPQAIERQTRELTLVPKGSLQFADQTETRCVYCGRPTTKSEAEAAGVKNLCDTCARLEHQKGVVNLEKFCQDEYLGWVFLSFATPLLDAAWEQAERINHEFAARHLIPPDTLHPSETGFDEYFQALAAIQTFQAKCDQQISSLGHGTFTIARFTHLAIYLLCEENYWKFLDFMNQERELLRIPTSLRAFLCRPKHPVWSLMERGAQYDPKQRDLYYHIAQGSVTMFTNTDVNTIRTLGTVARSERVPTTQLNNLVRTAMRTTLAELLLEIDVKAQESKIGQRFPGQLKNGLDALKAGDGFEGRERRAIFVKYVTKLRGEERR